MRWLSGRIRSPTLDLGAHRPVRSEQSLRQSLRLREGAGKSLWRLLLVGAVGVDPDLSAGRVGLFVPGPLPQRGATVTATLIVCVSRSTVVVTVSPGARVLR